MAKSGTSLPFQQLRQSLAAKSARTGPMRSAPSSFTVDLTNIADPPRTYYAQECWTELDRGSVGIFFAQRRRTEAGLRSLICIRMAPMYVVHWVRSIDDIHSPSIAEIANKVGAKAETLNPIAGEPDQTFESSANIAKTGMSGHDVTIDFIKISAFEIALAKGGKITKGDPLVRIDTRASLFLGLIQNLKEMSKAFPQDAQHTEDE